MNRDILGCSFTVVVETVVVSVVDTVVSVVVTDVVILFYRKVWTEKLMNRHIFGCYCRCSCYCNSQLITKMILRTGKRCQQSLQSPFCYKKACLNLKTIFKTFS